MSQNAAGTGVIRFGRFGLDEARRRLTRNGQPVALSGKPFDVLVALVEGRGGVVSRAELLERVWPGVIVEEANLTQAISVLRRRWVRGAARASTSPRFREGATGSSLRSFPSEKTRRERSNNRGSIAGACGCCSARSPSPSCWRELGSADGTRRRAPRLRPSRWTEGEPPSLSFPDDG
jgi:hypothetical protein